MGTAKRFASINPTQGTPGAIYDPPFAMNKDIPPKWSFGKAPSKKKKGRDIELKMDLLLTSVLIATLKEVTQMRS
jgi:hypothetical protein